MDNYWLKELFITHNGLTTKLEYSSAQLVIISETGYKLWYIEIDDIQQDSLLRMFNENEDIRITMTGLTSSGQKLDAAGYFHPNVMHHAAAIRGDGELIGF